MKKNRFVRMLALSAVIGVLTLAGCDNPADNETLYTPTTSVYYGFFHDYHCRPPDEKVDAGSCSTGCGTGGAEGTSMVNACQAGGHGIWLHPTSDKPSGEFLLFDAESSELLRAFLSQFFELTAASGKYYLKAEGYPVDAVNVPDGINKTFQDRDSVFHAVSVEGARQGEYGWDGFETNRYKLTLDALKPAGVTVNSRNARFTPPRSASAKSVKYGVKGYTVTAYNGTRPYKTDIIPNDPANPLTEINFSQLELPAGSYSFTVTAVYYPYQTTTPVTAESAKSAAVDIQ